MGKKLLEPITYYLGTMPVTAQWSLSVEITRNVAGAICEVLHGLAHKMNGGAIYYPDIQKEQTTCRYEWPIKWNASFPRYHLILSLVVGNADLKKIDVYLVDTSETKEISLAEIDFRNLIEGAQSESVRVINEAFGLIADEKAIIRNVIFYLDLGTFDPILEKISTEDRIFQIFPSYVSNDHKRISAVTVEVSAKNEEMAKAQALRDIAVFSALMTLGSGILFKTTNITWDKKSTPPQFVDYKRNVQARLLYPKNARMFKKGKNSERLQAGIIFPWVAYSKLSDDHKKTFIDGLFAYQTAKEVAHTHSTLSVVSYVASLSAIAGRARKKCKGELNCSECGHLEFQHDIVGDQLAVIETVASLLRIPVGTDTYVNLKKLVQRVYREQRSAYVHGAVLRHNEYHDKYTIPSALPTNTDYVSKLFFYSRDLDSIAVIARQALLRWLSKYSGEPLPERELGLEEIKVERKVGFQSSIRVPPKRMASLRFI